MEINRIKTLGYATLISIIVSALAMHLTYSSINTKYEKEMRSTFYISFFSERSDIDSVYYSVCDAVTTLRESEEGGEWSEKVITPESLREEGASCDVTITVYSNRSTVIYTSQSEFNCPDCHGTHHYRVVGDERQYEYLP